MSLFPKHVGKIFVEGEEWPEILAPRMCYYNPMLNLVFVAAYCSVFAIPLDEYENALKNSNDRNWPYVEIRGSRRITIPDCNCVLDMFTSEGELCILRIGEGYKIFVDTISHDDEKFTVVNTVNIDYTGKQFIRYVTLHSETQSGLIFICEDGYTLLDHSGVMSEYTPPEHFTQYMSTLSEFERRYLPCKVILDDGLIILDNKPARDSTLSITKKHASTSTSSDCGFGLTIPLN